MTGRSRRWHPWTALVVMAVVAAGGALAPAPAGAWERPVVLGAPSGWVDGPHLRVGSRGDALLAWSRGGFAEYDGGLPTRAVAEASLRPPGAPAWTPAELVSPPGELALGAEPVLLPSGEPAVAWAAVRRGVADATVSEAIRPAGGGWSVAPLDLLAARTAFDLQNMEEAGATAPDGTLAIARFDRSAEPPELRVQVRAPGGAWSETPALRGPGADEPPPQIVALDGGGLTAVWADRDAEPGGAGGTRLMAADWDPAARAWSIPRGGALLQGPPGDLRLAATPDGTAVAALTLHGPQPAVVASVRPPGGEFGPARVFRGRGDGLRVATGASGEAVVAWHANGGLRVTVRPAGGDWSRPEAAPPRPCVEGDALAAVAAGPSGEVLVAGSAGGIVRAWVREPSGAWTAPVWLARARAEEVTAAVDGSGRMHVAWQGQRMNSSRVVEATSAAPADAARAGVPQFAVPVLTRLRVTGRGSLRTARFRLSRPARVRLRVRGTGRREREFGMAVAGRRGANAAPLRAPRSRRLPPGVWRVSAAASAGPLTGCVVSSAPFVVRR